MYVCTHKHLHPSCIYINKHTHNHTKYYTLPSPSHYSPLPLTLQSPLPFTLQSPLLPPPHTTVSPPSSPSHYSLPSSLPLTLQSPLPFTLQSPLLPPPHTTVSPPPSPSHYSLPSSLTTVSPPPSLQSPFPLHTTLPSPLHTTLPPPPHPFTLYSPSPSPLHTTLPLPLTLHSPLHSHIHARSGWSSQVAGWELLAAKLEALQHQASRANTAPLVCGGSCSKGRRRIGPRRESRG